jgi:hypothetical protein
MITHQPTPQSWLIYIPIDSSRRQDSKCEIHILFDTWRQKGYDTYSLLQVLWNKLLHEMKENWIMA